MTDLMVRLPDALVAVIEARAAALGTTPEHWLEAMVEDVVADLPEGGDTDGWICR